MLTKSEIHTACLTHVNTRLSQLEEQMKQFQIAANEDTKSSMGDKYETGREMINLEKGKVAGQIAEMAKLQATLSGIDPEKTFDKVQLASLIETNHGLIYLSVGLGQIKIEGESVIVISTLSPLGQQLLDKHQGDLVSFGPRTYEVLSLY